MLSLRKFFKLPGPSHFNSEASDYALQSRKFSPEAVDVYCWEDYYADLKKAYPVKYFFAETLPDFIRYRLWFPIKRPISDLKYWIVSHLVPSRRYHMLDLRQPNGYRYGWRDTDQRMLYANFNLLNEFVAHEMDNFYCPTLEECEDKDFGPSNKMQRDVYFEILDLHKWWNVDRLNDEKRSEELVHLWHERRYKQKINDEETKKLFDEHLAFDQSSLDKETEMLIRLIKIRKSLWT